MDNEKELERFYRNSPTGFLKNQLMYIRRFGTNEEIQIIEKILEEREGKKNE